MDEDSRWRHLYGKKLEIDVVDSFRFFQQHGVEPILIKGWVAAQNYPPDVRRHYDDVDLAVSKSDFKIAKHLLSTEAGSRIGVDLHCEFRHLDTKPWNDVLKDSRQVSLNGVSIRIPSAEDHLRILAVHWLNDGGARKDRLWDVYYAVKNRPATFDWDRCLNSVSDVRRQWIIAAIGLAHKYLDLDISGFPSAESAKVLPPWLVAAVEKEWKSGVRLKSLHTCLREPRELLKQIRKRVPPNPLQATIEMEGNFDNGLRFRYQLGSMLNRIRPSVRGIVSTLTRRP